MPTRAFHPSMKRGILASAAVLMAIAAGCGAGNSSSKAASPTTRPTTVATDAPVTDAPVTTPEACLNAIAQGNIAVGNVADLSESSSREIEAGKTGDPDAYTAAIRDQSAAIS